MRAHSPGKLRRVATVLRKAQPRIDIEFDRKGKEKTHAYVVFILLRGRRRRRNAVRSVRSVRY